MKDQFATFEIAKKLHELGAKINSIAIIFGEDHKLAICLDADSIAKTFSKDTIKTPLYQQVIDWLRDSYDIIIAVNPLYFDGGDKYNYQFTISKRNTGLWEGGGFRYFAEAREAAITKALALIAEKKLSKSF